MSVGGQSPAFGLLQRRGRRCCAHALQPCGSSVIERRRAMAEFPAPKEGIVLTHFIVSDDVERSRRFYTEVLGGETVLEGEPSIVALANGWVIINVGGGPTEDKPTVTLETPCRPRPDEQLSQHPRGRHPFGLCRLEPARRRVPHSTAGPRSRDTLLYPRSRRSPDRGRPSHTGARPRHHLTTPPPALVLGPHAAAWSSRPPKLRRRPSGARLLTDTTSSAQPCAS